MIYKIRSMTNFDRAAGMESELLFDDSFITDSTTFS